MYANFQPFWMQKILEAFSQAQKSGVHEKKI
jgi:hypothetical protein